MAASSFKPVIIRIHILSLCLLVAVIPFAVSFISYAIALWLLTAIILMISQRSSISPVKYDAGLFLSLALYLLFVVGIFYSSNTRVALFDIQVKLSLLIVPPFIFLLRGLYQKYIKQVYAVFVAANIIAGIICIAVALYHSIHFSEGILSFSTTIQGIQADTNTRPPDYFSYTNLSLFKHPAYFSMYLLMCVFMVGWMWYNNISIVKSRQKNNWLFALAVVFMLLMVFLLESKAAYLSLLLLIFTFGAGYVITKKKWISGLALLTVIVLLSVIGINRNTRFYYIRTAIKNNSGFMDAVSKKDYKVLIDTYGLDRVPIWMISGELIHENLITGVGTGDVKDVLMAKYRKYGLVTLEQNNYNTHNQYLETFIATGIIGFIVLLLMVLRPLFMRKNYSADRFPVLAFTIIISTNYLFETVLNTIGGVIFVAFFYGFLLFVPGFSKRVTESADHIEQNTDPYQNQIQN